MRVLLIGLQYFANKLVEQLSSVYRNDSFYFLDLKKSLDRWFFASQVPLTDVVYVIGGSLTLNKALRLALAFRCRIIMQWVGSDVLTASKHFNSGLRPISNRLLTHLCEVEWIQQELAAIAISAQILPMAAIATTSPIKPLPKEFRILSYVGKGREDFYGLPYLLRLAGEFPDIDITVVGTDTPPPSNLSNLHILGWVKDMTELYDLHVLYLRLPEHDGIAFSALEALARGRYVGRTQAFFPTEHVTSYNEIRDLVIDLKQRFENGELSENRRGAEFVAQNYHPSRILTNIHLAMTGRRDPK